VALLTSLPRARPIAGGTDLIPNLRDGLSDTEALVDVSAISALERFEATAQGMTIGSGVTLARLVAAPELDGPFVAVREAAAAVAGPAHRTVATVGGNLCVDTRCVFYNQSAWWRSANSHCLKYGGETCHVAPQGNRCHAAFSGDLAPALLALDATVDVAGPGGVRRQPLAALYVDDGARHLALAHDELVTAVSVPAPAPGQRSGYRKARVRGGMEFPLAGVAACVVVTDGILAQLRIALTGTNSRPFLLDGTGGLIGKPLAAEALPALGKLVQRQVSPMRTTATAANYRRQVAAVLVQRLVADLAAP